MEPEANAILSELRIEARIEAEAQGSTNWAALSFAGSSESVLRFSSKNISLNNGRTQIWADEQYSLLSGSADREGHVASFRLGIVHSLKPTMDMGVYVSCLSAQTTQINPRTGIETEGLGVDACTKFEFGNGVRGGVSVFHEESENTSIIGGATGQFYRSYTSFEASIEHSYLVNGWRITPALEVGSVTSAHSGFTDSTGAVTAALTETYNTAKAEVDFVRTFEVN